MLACASLFAASTAQAATIDSSKLDKIEREMKIMNNILRTSLKEQINSRPSIDSVYLADQGMLFTIEQRQGYRFEFRERRESFPDLAPLPALPTLPDLEPLAPVSVEFTESQIEQIEEAAMVAAESAMEMAEISLEYISDVDWSSVSSSERSAHKAQQTQLRSEKRELEKQARKLEREVRNIERKLRDSEFEEQLERAEQDSKKTAALKDQMDKLTHSLAQVADKIKANSAKLQKKANEIKQQQEKKLKARLELTEKVISESVCDFGSGLRSLQKGQHMTVRIEGETNRLYVFSKEHIMKCGNGKVTAAKLLEQATKYEM